MNFVNGKAEINFSLTDDFYSINMNYWPNVPTDDQAAQISFRQANFEHNSKRVASPMKNLASLFP